MALSIEGKTVLYSCLNWGSGHLSRSIGVIRELLELNNTVIFAGDEFQQSIIAEYFPEISLVELKSYPFNFSNNGTFASDLLKSRKALLKHVRYEFDEVELLLKKFPRIECVISDHRYGFFSNKIQSIFITHQVFLPLKWYQFAAQYIHTMLMQSFNEIWIMDTEEDRLAGKLSAKPKRKSYLYIGHYSRFKKVETARKDIQLGVVNGPKPFSDQLFEVLLNRKEIDKIIVPQELYYTSLDSRLVNTNSWLEADLYFYQANIIHAYCGYTTLMDLKVLGCKAVLEPTPGQLEQIYLYRLYSQKDKL